MHMLWFHPLEILHCSGNPTPHTKCVLHWQDTASLSMVYGGPMSKHDTAAVRKHHHETESCFYISSFVLECSSHTQLVPCFNKQVKVCTHWTGGQSLKFICTKESEIEITANTISGNLTCLSVPTGYQKVTCSLEHAVFHLLGHSKRETHWAVSRLQSCHNFTTQSYHACSEECKQLVCNNNCWLHSKTNWVASYSPVFVQGNKHTQLCHFWMDALLCRISVP